LMIALVATVVIPASADNGRPSQKEPSDISTSPSVPLNPPITWSMGYLGLVLPSAPNDTILRWTADTVDCGGFVRSPWFRMKNFGTESMQLCSPVEPESEFFTVESNCNCFNTIEPGVMTGCSLQITFIPNAAGLLRDTMRIETDARNSWGGYVRVPISGVQASTPAAPVVVLLIQDMDAHLFWNSIHRSVSGCPMTVSGSGDCPDRTNRHTAE
jgi:hypothetical protein